jgi:hypothetical protein
MKNPLAEYPNRGRFKWSANGWTPWTQDPLQNRGIAFSLHIRGVVLLAWVPYTVVVVAQPLAACSFASALIASLAYDVVFTCADLVPSVERSAHS